MQLYNFKYKTVYSNSSGVVSSEPKSTFMEKWHFIQLQGVLESLLLRGCLFSYFTKLVVTKPDGKN